MPVPDRPATPTELVFAPEIVVGESALNSDVPALELVGDDRLWQCPEFI